MEQCYIDVLNNNFQFNNFLQIVDYYLMNFNLLENNSKYNFECKYGCLEFHKKNNSNIIVHEIYINEMYRNKGLCKEFLKYLIDNSITKHQIIIQSVLSKILYYFLLRFEHNGYKFYLKKQGFYCGKISLKNN